MRRCKNIWLIMLLACAIFISKVNCSEAQQEFKIVPQTSHVNINGTSNLHDWQMSLKTADCKITLTEENNEIKSIEKADFSCKVNYITCSESIMNKKAHDAFTYNKYPDIIFTMNSLENFIFQNGSFSGTAVGILNMAGKSKKINMEIKGKLTNNTINIEATEKIDMTEWGMEPPTAMLGILKTGKDVTVSFNLNLMQ